MRFSLIFSIFTLITCLSLAVHAQNTAIDTAYRLIEKNDGIKYIAKILSDDARELLIETETIGKIYIYKSEIKRISVINPEAKIVNGELFEESPFSTRYAFTNNALPIKKGSHYAMTNWYGPEVHFALTDRLNIGVMTTWIGSPFVLVGKYSFPTSNPKVNFSLGSMFGTSSYINTFRGFGGLHWATFTYGDRSNNISISAGYGYMTPGNLNNNYVEGVYVGDSIVYENIDGSIFVDYQYPTIPRNTESKMYQSHIFSVAGIYQITARTSIFFDSMFGYVSRAIGNNFPSYTGGNNTPVIATVLPVSATNTNTNALYFMPGLRFQRKENNAFQIALAGVSVWDESENYTFPLPMISWFFKI